QPGVQQEGAPALPALPRPRGPRRRGRARRAGGLDRGRLLAGGPGAFLCVVAEEDARDERVSWARERYLSLGWEVPAPAPEAEGPPAIRYPSSEVTDREDRRDAHGLLPRLRGPRPGCLPARPGRLPDRGVLLLAALAAQRPPAAGHRP